VIKQPSIQIHTILFIRGLSSDPVGFDVCKEINTLTVLTKVLPLYMSEMSDAVKPLDGLPPAARDFISDALDVKEDWTLPERKLNNHAPVSSDGGPKRRGSYSSERLLAA
jgi:hypothetical protein